MDGNKRFRVNEPGVLCQQFDQEVAVVHLATGNYHSLSGIAAEAFLILGSAGASRDDVVAELLLRYDTSREVIEKDLSVFLEELQSQRLIVPAREGAPRVIKAVTERPQPALPIRPRRSRPSTTCKSCFYWIRSMTWA